MVSRHVAEPTFTDWIRNAEVFRVLLVVIMALSMILLSADPASAQEGGPSHMAAARVDSATGSVEAFSYVAEQAGYTWKQTFNLIEPANVVSNISFSGPEGAIFHGVGTASPKVDGSTIVTIVSPQLDAPHTRIYQPGELSEADPVCWPCVAAAGLAAGGAVIACAFTALLGCAAATGLGAAGATAYCSTNPCAPAAPSCTPNAMIWQQQAGAGQLNYQYSADCNQVMEYINIRGELVRNNSVVVFSDFRSCLASANCWQGWYAYNLSSGCYRSRVFFDAKWKNKATNEVRYYEGQATSGNQICF